MKVELTKGEMYTVELYPKNEQISAEYVGLNKETHVFAGRDRYIFVNEHFITSRGGNIISHIRLSPYDVLWLKKDGIEKISREHPTIKLLKELGENI